MSELIIDNHKVKITNPEKILWPEADITKSDYIKYLIDISPHLLKHTYDRILTIIRYPHGVSDKSFYQKHLPDKAPEFVKAIKVDNDIFMNLDNLATLLWLGNMAAIELHVTFNKYQKDSVNSLVFDLDPSEGQEFKDVVDCALIIYNELEKVGVKSYAKTSGSSGIQIYIPTKEYSYEDARKINTFFANFFVEKYPEKMTIERLKKNRKGLLYFDYQQMWRGKNIIAPYSPRAKSCASVSMPITWQELKDGINPCDFTVLNAAQRVKDYGDLFAVMENGDSSNCDFLDKLLL